MLAILFAFIAGTCDSLGWTVLWLLLAILAAPDH